MRACRTLLFAAFATLWMVAASHCRLEVLPGFEFLSCCEHSDADKDPAHHEDGCCTDGCAAVESGLYKLSKPQQAPEKPVLALIAWVIPMAADEPVAHPGLLVGDVSAPPELPQTWHFSQRTAPVPRAPSFVS